jgi:predicted phage terminase large subunit-like protein
MTATALKDSAPTLPLSIEAYQREIERRKLEAARQDADAIRRRCKSFAGYVKEAWPIIEPGTTLKWNWHMQAMCDHLEAITFGRMSPWLIINVPPGSSKSTIVSVLWQSWEWGPCGLRHNKFVSTSFEEGNVKRDTRKTRNLILSDWYQTLWPEVSLTRTAELSFENADTGTREGVTFAAVTGKRGDRLVVDDPHSIRGAESEAERSRACREFLEGGLNRTNDAETSAIVIVMQRLHETDLTGTLLARDLGFTHLCIPMEFEPERRVTTPIGWTDPRETDGELMDPVRFPRTAIDKLKKAGEYSWAGQYQQRPFPRGGGMFKRDWFEIIPAVPTGCIWVRGWDFAATRSTRAAYTAGVKMGRMPDGRYVIADVRRKQGTAAEVETLLKNTASQDGYGVRGSIPQDPGQAGKAQVQYLIRQLAGYSYTASTETGDKETRAEPFAAQAQVGNVLIVAGPWNEEYLSELESFPSGTFKDQVDATSRAFNELVNGSSYNLDNV